jgi:hypothetical protein
VEEVVQGRVGDRPRLLVVQGTASRGGVLLEVERRVAAFVAVVDQAAHHGVVLAGPGWGGDGQQEGAVPLACPGGHGLIGVVGDHVQLVHDG